MSRQIPQRMITGMLDPDNSTNATLGASGSFTGQWVRIVDFGILYVNVIADVASATDGLKIEMSSNGIDADHEDAFTIPANTGKNFSINCYAAYYRIRYVNGGSVQGTFRLQSILKWNGKPSSHRIQDSITSDDDAELNKAVLTGETPSGSFVNFAATHRGNFKVAVQEYGDTPAIDAFDRLRVSYPYTIFDSKQVWDKQPLFFDESIGGSATSTHSTVHARTQMEVTASASDFAIRQTKQRFNYQPGKSKIVILTGLVSQQTGITKRLGFFDGTGTNYLTPNNGIFFQSNGSTISWNIAKNGSTTESVSQANWNVDPMDGTGPSGITLDLDAVEIFLMDIEWLGVGRCRVGFVIDGLIHYVHFFNHANDPTFTSVYMSTPNLPIRYDIQSDGSGSGSIDHICGTVMSEGGLEETGVSRSVDTENTHLDANAADTPYVVLALRLKSTHLDLTVLPEFITMISETADDFRWSIHLNPTYNSTLTYSDITNSGCQYAAGVTANDITDQGIKLDSGYAQSLASIERQFKNNLRIGSLIDGTRDELILAVTPLSSNADIQASLTFRELL